MRIKTIIALAAAVLLQSGAIAATREEAQQFVARAAAHVKQHGRDKALEAFNNPAGAFVSGELYIVVLDMKGVVLADGNKPRLRGRALIDLKDRNGKQFVREEIALAKAKGKGWVDFDWVNPVSGELEARSSYLEKVDDMIVLTGVYRQR